MSVWTAELVINFDQTTLNYAQIPDWMMEKKGTKQAEVIAKDNSQLSLQALKQERFCLCSSSTKERLIIAFHITPSWHVTKTPTQWSNEHMMKEYVTNIILPYVNGKRRALKLAREQPVLLLFHNFKAQCISSFLTLLDANDVSVESGMQNKSGWKQCRRFKVEYFEAS